MNAELGQVVGTHAEHDTQMWLNQALRPREYAELDWVNARSLLQPVTVLARPQPYETAADIGTGTGAVLLEMAPHVRHAIGVDISEAMLTQLNERVTAAGVRNVRLLQADIRDQLPMADGSLDIVTTRMMLHDLDDPTGAIKDMWRLVRPGGKLVALEYITDTCQPAAVDLTDAFEAGQHGSSLLPAELFAHPSEDLVRFHRSLFELKQEPERYLWTADQFKARFVEACDDVTAASMFYTLAPFNSVDNWLGHSGFGLDVKQAGIRACLNIASELQQELGMVITVNGQPISPADQPGWARYYEQASSEERERLKIDAKIHRVFANVVLQKGNNSDRAAA